jgi:hypothetical protein
MMFFAIFFAKTNTEIYGSRSMSEPSNEQNIYDGQGFQINKPQGSSFQGIYNSQFYLNSEAQTPPQISSPSAILDFSRPTTALWQGREEELKQLRSWLSDGSTRFISITAAGGYGKSTLASKLYETVSEFDDDKKLWVYFRQAYSFIEWARSLIKLWDQDLDERHFHRSQRLKG